jgi:predicted cupin superfamily sugar epimerase
MDAHDVVSMWHLQPHPEGGFYRQTYRSALQTLPSGWPAPRPLATAILYLLPAGEQSAWHRIRGEELWLWQGGGPMRLDIAGTERLVGSDREAGHDLHVLVPAGEWQRATPARDDWSLVACLVAPGFDFADFELR